jgi:hypothetical protein
MVNVADTDEAGALVRGINVETTGLHFRLVGDDTDNDPINPGKSSDDVGREVRHDLEEGILIGEHVDDIEDIEGNLRVGRNEVFEAVVDVETERIRQGVWGVIDIVGGQVRHEGLEPARWHGRHPRQ